MKPRVPPIAQFAVGRSQFSRELCRDQTNDHVRTIGMIKLCGKHDGGSHFSRAGAGKRTDYDVAGFQTPSRSCCSNRFRDAAVASRKSSSDQESDHSTGCPPLRYASCCAQTSTFLASSGGSIRTTLMSDSSLALRIMLLIFYAFRRLRRRAVDTHRSELTVIGHLSPRDWDFVRAGVRESFAV